MFEWSKWKLPSRARVLLFHLVFLAVWCVFSLPAFLRNDPTSFQAAGSIVVAFAIYNLSRARADYERVHQAHFINRFSAHVLRLDEHHKAQEERIDFTVEILSYHLRQSCDKLGIRHIWDSSPDEMKRTS
jgi:hypothetical protein